MPTPPASAASDAPVHRRTDIDWTAIFAEMVATGRGARATARAHGLPSGTVLVAVKRERERGPGNRLERYAPGVVGGQDPAAGGAPT